MIRDLPRFLNKLIDFLEKKQQACQNSFLLSRTLVPTLSVVFSYNIIKRYCKFYVQENKGGA